MPTKAEELPVIKLKLGDDFETIQKNSTFHFGRRPSEKIDAIFATEPFVFEYTCPHCSFKLPPGRSFDAGVDDGHATSIWVAPHLSYLSQEQAIALAFQISALRERSGWKRTEQYLSEKETRAEFANPKKSSQLTLDTEEWQCGDDTLVIEISRDWRRGESLPRAAHEDHDYMRVAVNIDNEKLSQKYPG